ncbi:MAG TPA: methyltransferase domain-containing protein [Capsulimonadaceae bacterium]|nr:methyltransferase domain-containing protein [Capsulimonadaceae bacterium]
MQIDHTHRFTNRAGNYAKHRPRYPQEIATFLAGEIGFTPSSIIADIGSGTGLLSELWLKNGNPVYGVEPNTEMREMAERLLAGNPNFHSIDGAAEATTLPNKSIDLVSAGSAFHWFDADRARAEFQRILKPGGYVLLTWNTRKHESSPFTIALRELFQKHGTNRQSADHRRQREDRLREFFGESGYKLAIFENRQALDWEGLKGHLLSLSVAPLPVEPGYEPMIDHLRRVYDTYQQDDKIRIEYNTQVFYGPLG